MNLAETIREYVKAAAAFRICTDMLKSESNIPQKSKDISERYFDARDALEKACQESDEPKAQRYAETAKLAHECARLQLENPVGNQNECMKRMKDYNQAELDLLGL